MYAFNITIKNKNPGYKDIAEDMTFYIMALEGAGQVLQNKEIGVFHNNIITTPVLCPEIDAYKIENCSRYALDSIKRLEEKSGSKIEYIQTGRSAEYPDYKVPENLSHYISWL